VPGTGTPAQQLHDFNGGILASGLFWTVPAERHDLWVSRDGRRAVLEMRDVPVIDSFQFFSPNQIAAEVSFRIEWRASGPFVQRGSGDPDPPTDIAAFLGDIAPARSTASCSGEEWGFSFRSNQATTELPGPLRGYAQMGHTRNGVFLES
jgi:hypothetical protein